MSNYTRDDKKPNWIKRHKILSGILGFILLLIVIGAANGGNTPTKTESISDHSSHVNNVPNTSNTSASPSATTTPKLNQPASDGKFQFEVASIQCNIAEINQPDDPDWTSTSGAPYCEVKVNVKDIGTAGQTFEDDAQYIYSASGNQYSIDDEATISANTSGNNCMEDPTVNPGVTITCTLAYDVPKGVTPVYAMLHDSSLSNGVKVNLQ